MDAATYHHVTISVTDLDRSLAWYERVLGARPVAERNGPTWRRTLIRTEAGLVMAVTQHGETPADDRFDERRVGLDHLAIACPDGAAVDEWHRHLAEIGEEPTDITRAPHATLFICRDPDGIPIEFYALN